MNRRTTQTVNKDNLKWLEVTEVSLLQRMNEEQAGAIHTHKYYYYGLRKKKTDDLYSFSDAIDAIDCLTQEGCIK